MAEKKIEVKNLTITFKTDNGLVQAVRDISFDLYEGETLCIVGESGSGKSVTSKAIMGILANNAIVESGSIVYEGENLLDVSEEEFHKIRGHKIGMIFQDPLSSLNPIMRIGKQITEATLINANIIKQKYNDLISKELMAYKNSIARNNILIAREKNRVKLLEAEYSKKISQDSINKYFTSLILKEQTAYDEVVKDYNLKVFEENGKIKSAKNKNSLKSLWKFFIDAFKTNNSNQNRLSNAFKQLKEYRAENNKEIAAVTEEANKNKALYKTELDTKLPPIQQELDAKKAEVSPIVVEYKNKMVADYEAKIATAKAESAKNIEESKAKLKEVLPGLKAALKERKKSAKKEIKEYEISLKNEYKENLAKIEMQYEDKTSEDYKKAVESCKNDYISKTRITKAEAKRRAIEIMREVGIPMPEKRYRQYPFEFSGGMRQRIVIAIALTASPDVLICDEPTTALDVTIQAQILELIKRLKKERNISCIFITHDLGVVANMADRVAVMYAGKIVEYGTAEEIFFEPKHPYTWALLSSIPDVDSKERLEAIPGTPPDMIYPPVGDAFALRSKYAMQIDFKYQPPFFKVSDTHYAATWLLHPDAPKVEMPKIVSERIRLALKASQKDEANKTDEKTVEKEETSTRKPATRKSTAKKGKGESSNE